MNNKAVATIKNIDEILAARDLAIKTYREGLEKMAAAKLAMTQCGFGEYVITQCFSNLSGYDIETPTRITTETDKFTKAADKNLWDHLHRISGIAELMDHTAKKEWSDGLEKNVPACTMETVVSTFENLHAQRNLIFNRGLVKAFEKLSGRYKTNDAFKIGKKIIVSHVGSFYNSGSDHITDVERVLYALDGKKPPSRGDSVLSTLNSFSKPHGVFQSDYMHIKVFKNQNAHVTFKCPKLIEQANRIIAAFYGETIPDGRRG